MKFVFKKGLLDKFEDKLNKLNKKCERIGVEKINYNIIREFLDYVEIKEEYFDANTDSMQYKYIKSKNMVEFVEIECDDKDVVLNGYTLKGILKRNVEDFIYFGEDDNEVPTEIKESKPICQHCNTNRRRNKYYIVEKDGEYLTIGSSCVKDFLKVDNVENIFRILDYKEELKREMFIENLNFKCFYNYFNLNQVIKCSMLSIDKYGYQKTYIEEERNPNSTRDDVLRLLYDAADEEINEINKIKDEKVEEIINTVKKIKATNDFIRNIHNILSNTTVADSFLGFAVYIYQLYIKEKTKEDAKEELKGKMNSFIGNKGDKLQFKAKYVKWHRVYGYYGARYYHTFEDDKGNFFIWSTNKSLSEINEGDLVELKGTIKEHTNFNGIKQNMMTRCKILS